MFIIFVYSNSTTKVQNLHFLNHNFKLKSINFTLYDMIDSVRVTESVGACKLIDESKLLDESKFRAKQV